MKRKYKIFSELSGGDLLPIEFFDFVIVDECHRSIYNLWKQVLDYYDSFFNNITGKFPAPWGV